MLWDHCLITACKGIRQGQTGTCQSVYHCAHRTSRTAARTLDDYESLHHRMSSTGDDPTRVHFSHRKWSLRATEADMLTLSWDYVLNVVRVHCPTCHQTTLSAKSPKIDVLHRGCGGEGCSSASSVVHQPHTSFHFPYVPQTSAIFGSKTEREDILLMQPG